LTPCYWVYPPRKERFLIFQTFLCVWSVVCFAKHTSKHKNA
jgi:hypothetical protein